MTRTPEHNAKIAAAMRLKWQDPEFKAKQKGSTANRPAASGDTKRILAEMWSDPATRERMTVSPGNPLGAVQAFVRYELRRRKGTDSLRLLIDAELPLATDEERRAELSRRRATAAEQKKQEAKAAKAEARQQRQLAEEHARTDRRIKKVESQLAIAQAYYDDKIQRLQAKHEQRVQEIQQQLTNPQSPSPSDTPPPGPIILQI
jgi:hypothetical protein